MPWRGQTGQSQSRTGIYLVDNKHGGIEMAQADVYCAELELSRGLFNLFLKTARWEKLWGRLVIGVLQKS